VTAPDGNGGIAVAAFDAEYFLKAMARGRENLQTRLATIADEEGLTDQARRQRRSDAYDQATSVHRELLRGYNDGVEGERKRLIANAFGAPGGPGGDPASYRQALAMAEAAKDLAALVERCDLLGDLAGKRAALFVAWQRGNVGLVERTGDPEARELAAFERRFGELRTTSQRMSDGMAMRPPARPTGL
jgi:hypothetical protein